MISCMADALFACLAGQSSSKEEECCNKILLADCQRRSRPGKGQSPSDLCSRSSVSRTERCQVSEPAAGAVRTGSWTQLLDPPGWWHLGNDYAAGSLPPAHAKQICCRIVMHYDLTLCLLSSFLILSCDGRLSLLQVLQV